MCGCLVTELKNQDGLFKKSLTNWRELKFPDLGTTWYKRVGS